MIVVTQHPRAKTPRRQFPSIPREPNRRRQGERRSVDPEVLPLVPDFIKNRRDDAANIPLLVSAGALGEVQRLGHNMKGNGVSYGFPRISEIGAQVVQAAKDGDTAALLRLNQELVHLLEGLPISGSWPIR